MNGRRAALTEPAAVLAALLAAVLVAGCGTISPAATWHPQASDENPGSPLPARTETAVPVTAVPATTEACELPPVRARAAQLLLVGIPGTAADEAALELVREGVGGVVLLGSNVETADQVASLVLGLQAEAPIPLAVAIDEEPGRIGRLAKAAIIAGSPSARSLGKRTAKQVEATGRRIGSALADLGITVDLAPVLDVTGAAAGGVIGDRAFGSSPAVVSRAGVAFLAGLTKAGVAGVGKHFPGHGETTTDSHTDLPLVSASRRTLERRALPPFEAAIEAGIPAIMVGHLLVPALDATRPASLSRKVIDGLLRDDLGFDGVVMADDLNMGALDRYGELPERTELAIRAGVDLAIVLDHRAVPDVIERLVESVEAGRLPESRLDEAFLRVARFKGLDDWAGCDSGG
ncbi:MAG: Beta-hexosaminidase [Chloroflexi bacterium]|nr:Beta-hexosaminidase [Chloroflexota bacterium]